MQQTRRTTLPKRPPVLLLTLLLTLLLALGVMSPLLAQEGEIILTVLTPEWMGDVFTDEFFDAFEAQHPGVKVVLAVPRVESFDNQAAYKLDEYLNTAAQYAAQADVLHISPWSLGVEATRAGYFLDLRPLVDGDPTFMPEDFMPGALDIFRWDNGLWAIPVSLSAQLVIYDAAAFDAAGLAYPDAGWTLSDFAAASRALTQYDDDGNITLPGFHAWNAALLYRALTGQTLYDEASIPQNPQFATPEVEAFLAEWIALEEEGLLNYSEGDFDYNALPLSIEQTWRLNSMAIPFAQGENEQRLQAAPLPGGGAGLMAEAFAISAGTLHPELSFALLKFMTSSPTVVQRFFGDSPARRSLIGVEPEETEGGMTFFTPELPEEIRATIDSALENPIPNAELRFWDYVSQAVSAARDEERAVDLQTALRNAENQAFTNLEAATQRRQSEIVSVATPVPTPVLGANEIALDFGLQAFVSPLPNREQWEQAIAEFVAADPQVGSINLNTGFGSMQDMQQADCYYMPQNTVPYADLSTLLSLDPFLDADPNFDRNDVLPGVLTQLQREGRTYAYPLTIHPVAMWYRPDAFTELGLPEPEVGWTVDQFVSALQTFQQNQGEDQSASLDGMNMFGNTLWMMLFATYGGVPIDYNTTPPTLHLSDPVVQDAMRQVLDLARADLIAYQELDVDTLIIVGGGGGGGGEGGFGPALQVEMLSAFNFRLENLDNPDVQDPYRLTSIPRGSTFAPVSFDVGTAYINAATLAPEACYRWISFIASRPALFTAMPARRSLLSDPGFMSTQPEVAAAFYSAYADLLSDPNAISVASPALAYGGSPGVWLEAIWFNQALDAYVLEDQPLEDALRLAEQNINAYRDCTAPLPPFDPALVNDPEAAQAYYDQFTDCAIAVDPALATRFARPE